MRNLKLFNHWIAKVREIALGKVYHMDEKGKTDTPLMMSKADLKYVFNKDTMISYFNDGKTPQESFEEEVSNWE